jgi:hypothetical protein
MTFVKLWAELLASAPKVIWSKLDSMSMHEIRKIVQNNAGCLIHDQEEIVNEIPFAQVDYFVYVPYLDCSLFSSRSYWESTGANRKAVFKPIDGAA